MFISKIYAHYVPSAEYKSNYTYKEANTDDGVIISAFDEKNKKVGSITFIDQYVQEDGWPFDMYQDQPFYAKITDHEMVICIQDLSVLEQQRNKGIAGELMKRAMSSIKKKYSGFPIYINASPYGISISLESLISFYTKFGFKVLKRYPEYRNALLWRDK